MIYEITNDQTAINWGSAGRERIAQNVRNLLNTYRYEIPFARVKGLPPNLVDMPLQEARTRCVTEISNLITLFEPLADLRSVTVDGDPAKGDLFIKAVIDIA